MHSIRRASTPASATARCDSSARALMPDRWPRSSRPTPATFPAAIIERQWSNSSTGGAATVRRPSADWHRLQIALQSQHLPRVALQLEPLGRRRRGIARRRRIPKLLHASDRGRIRADEQQAAAGNLGLNRRQGDFHRYPQFDPRIGERQSIVLIAVLAIPFADAIEPRAIPDIAELLLL